MKNTSLYSMLSPLSGNKSTSTIATLHSPEFLDHTHHPMEWHKSTKHCENDKTISHNVSTKSCEPVFGWDDDFMMKL
jgi:hypothetical protein